MHSSQKTANQIKALAKAKRIAIGKLLQDCNLNKNALSTMKSGGHYPHVETVCKIADYLDCSVDYLLGRTDCPDLITKNTHNNPTFYNDK